MSEQQVDAIPTRAERKTLGKSRRKAVPRRSHSDWKKDDNRPDPIDLLQAQDAGRIKHLVPIKYGRMVESPFAFLRGSAVVMSPPSFPITSPTNRAGAERTSITFAPRFRPSWRSSRSMDAARR